MNQLSGALSFPGSFANPNGERFDNTRFAERASSASQMHDELLAKIDRDRGAVDFLDPLAELRELAGGQQGRLFNYWRGPARRA